MDFSSDKDLEHPLYVCGTGRRKRSTAWVTIFKDVKSAKMTISTNRRKPELVDINNYDRFNHAHYLSIMKSPLVELGLEKTYGVHVIVRGGGTRGQIDAIKLAIARALCKLPFNRTPLKSAGYLQCDDRRKERKKYGLRKARKAPQYSKR